MTEHGNGIDEVEMPSSNPRYAATEYVPASDVVKLRAQVAFYEGPPKTPGRVTLVPAAQRAPLYAAYRAAREWAEKNGESYTDDGIIQAAVGAYRVELVTQARKAAEESADTAAGAQVPA